MPPSTEILADLTAIANGWTVVAIAWHVAVAAALVAFARGWRPRPRTAGVLISLPLLSVAVFAIAYGNPFNGIVFGVFAIALFALAVRSPDESLAPQPTWARMAGGLMIAFGWFYPHFLLGDPIQYLYAAPTGLVPCPTLAIALGFALLWGGPARSWSWTLVGVATFYALFGAFRLGVRLDYILLVGAAFLAIRTWRAGAPRRSTSPGGCPPRGTMLTT